MKLNWNFLSAKQKAFREESTDKFSGTTHSVAAGLIMTHAFLFLLFYYRDKHGRPMSHPEYDPRTLLVINAIAH